MQSGRVQIEWRVKKPIVGMVHLLPLPGAPRFGGSLAEVLDRAAADTRALLDGGVDGVMVENYGDAPFFADSLPAVTISALTLAVAEVRRTTTLPVGVNALRNDAASALSIAVCTGARLVRVNVHSGAMLTDQGWITGKAAETLRLRSALNAPVAILADVLVKHAVAPAGLTVEDAAHDAWERGGADGLIVSGAATGAATDIEEARRIKRVLRDAPLWIGSGVNADNIAALLSVADGVIVGTEFESGGRVGSPVVVDRVRRVVDVARELHS